MGTKPGTKVMYSKWAVPTKKRLQEIGRELHIQRESPQARPPPSPVELPQSHPSRDARGFRSLRHPELQEAPALAQVPQGHASQGALLTWLVSECPGFGGSSAGLRFALISRCALHLHWLECPMLDFTLS